ncbi:hypothetical protein L861_05570 [Litchfieldella anticariensis FP35 = DSM 16096]|uniref:Uncharacterized protein n=3 Tax=Litchfieldella anticariensis TaxID=258591 RepID=S2KZN3_LITA3|nr:hypothetical protein L861_05570 [Halomonas anticariensis FP35 = DSM 16096]
MVAFGIPYFLPGLIVSFYFGGAGENTMPTPRDGKVRELKMGRKVRPGQGGRREWTLVELACLERHFHFMTMPELQMTHFPHRTQKAIRRMAYKLGLKKREPNRDYGQQPWTEEELSLVAQHYPTLKAREVQSRFLPHRSVLAIRHAAKKFGIRVFSVVPWTEQELAILRREFPRGGHRQVRKHLPHRSEAAIKFRARAEGLSYTPHGDGGHGEPWSVEELQRLEDNRALPAEELAALFPHRHKRSVINKRYQLGWTPVKQWSPEELQRLRDHLDLSVDQLCELFPDRPREGVRIKRDRLRRAQRKNHLARLAHESTDAEA